MFYGGHANLEETDKTDKLGTGCFFVPGLMRKTRLQTKCGVGLKNVCSTNLLKSDRLADWQTHRQSGNKSESCSLPQRY